MSQAKVALNKHRRKRLPVLGAAGLSLWLGGGAPAAASVGTTDMPTCSDAVDQEHPLREEEITDINLSTFYISDRERTPPLLPRIAAGACVACAASSEQPAYSGPVTRMSPPARKPTRPDVQTFKRPQERPPVPKHQNASRNQLEARPRATDQNAGRNLREAAPRATDQNATGQAQPGLDGLVINQSAGHQAEPQMATPLAPAADQKP
jgi:hypothetical protein